MEQIKNMDRSELNTFLDRVGNKAPEVMSELLTDPATTTYTMYEDLMYAYISGTDEFKAGLDKAVEIMLWYNLQEVSEKVEKASKE